MAPRVWEAFLSEQDRADVARRSRQPFGGGQRPLVLFVDLYRAVFGDRPEPLPISTQRWPASCGLAGWTALPAIRSLLRSARRQNIPVAHTTGLRGIGHWHRPATNDGTGQPPAGDPVIGPAQQSEWYEIIPEVAPMPDELVIRKAAPSAFWGTPLVAHLQQLRIDTVVVAGESTSGCVRATVVDGASHRLHMVVPEDCVFDRHEASHAISLFDMQQKYADVVSLRLTLAYLRSRDMANPAAPASGAGRSGGAA